MLCVLLHRSLFTMLAKMQFSGIVLATILLSCFSFFCQLSPSIYQLRYLLILPTTMYAGVMMFCFSDNFRRQYIENASNLSPVTPVFSSFAKFTTFSSGRVKFFILLTSKISCLQLLHTRSTRRSSHQFSLTLPHSAFKYYCSKRMLCSA